MFIKPCSHVDSLSGYTAIRPNGGARSPSRSQTSCPGSPLSDLTSVYPLKTNFAGCPRPRLRLFLLHASASAPYGHRGGLRRVGLPTSLDGGHTVWAP